MRGKLIGIGIVAIALLFGVGLYYSQIYAYYTRVGAADPGAEIRLTPLVGGVPEAVPVEDFSGIDAETSPLKYRACFTLPLGQAMLTETYRIHDDPVPLVAPGWFGCFDAGEITEALDSGGAVAFLGERNIRYGIDRVVAVFPDGRAFAWHQINDCGAEVFEGRPAPEGCPPLPGRE